MKLEFDACASLALTPSIENRSGLTTETYHVEFVDGVGIDIQSRSFEHASLEALALHPDKEIHLVELAPPMSLQNDRHQ